MKNPEVYQVFAIRYAHLENRKRHDNFIATDFHDHEMPLDYFVWALVNARRTIVVDTGFDHSEGKKRGRQLLRLPAEGLSLLGIDATTVEEVIITHLHYDHAGTTQAFPKARFHLQDLEMAYATGRFMCHEPFKQAYSVEHVVAFVQHLYDNRVTFHEGDAELFPGVSVHLMGGHTRGLQAVRVFTQRGWVVLASDASHFYENMEAVRPFPIVYHVGEMVEGYTKLRALADSPEHIIPGHDPLVMKRYPAPNPDLEGIVAQLHVPPKTEENPIEEP